MEIKTLRAILMLIWIIQGKIINLLCGIKARATQECRCLHGATVNENHAFLISLINVIVFIYKVAFSVTKLHLIIFPFKVFRRELRTIHLRCFDSRLICKCVKNMEYNSYKQL